MSKENEYKEIFLAEALENIGELNRLLTQFEKNPSDNKPVHAIFRITHTLKGNALGMGFDKIAELSHSLEDLFGVVREGRLTLSSDVISSVFRAVDVLGALVNALTSGADVKYKGIKTKLEVLVQRSDEVKNAVPSESEVQSNPVNVVDSNLISAAEDSLISDDDEQLHSESDDENLENKIVFSDLVQVPVRKLDNLLNLVGELIIEKDRIMAIQNGNRNDYNRLNRISSDLQYSMMDVRLVQVGFLFNKFHRVVRDAATSENKSVTLKLEGTDTEIDRNVLQVISDSLIHLIRNAVGHGIETEDERKQLDKTPEGTITLTAYSEADAVVIKIQDDGKGIDLARVRAKAIEKGIVNAEAAAQLSEQETIMLIFEPGFSTMDSVTSIAGRGVGMDVVKRALDSIAGSIHVETKLGEGSTFKLILPSSMAVKSTLLFELRDEHYAMPLSFTESVVSLYAQSIIRVGEGLVAQHLGRTISIVFLNDLFDSASDPTLERKEKIMQRGLKSVHPEQKLDIVVASHNGRSVGFVVDKLYQQKEIIEKPLSKPIDKVNFISGVSIMGNGRVCLVLNVAALVNYIFSASSRNRNAKV